MAKHRYQHQIDWYRIDWYRIDWYRIDWYRIDWSRIRDRLVYLPGAFILGYGLWLALIT
jgi:hypothetical protein